MTYVTKKQQAIQTQLSALLCDQFRITLKPRRDKLPHENYGNVSAGVRKNTGKTERFWSCMEVASKSVIKDLTVANMKGYDIYITPISCDYHHVVVDDVTQSALDAMLLAGYRPALIQRSSENNHQVIIIVGKVDRTDEQSLANKLVSQVNQKYGDQKFSGVVHPFRLAGFLNKKEGRGNALTSVLSAARCVCMMATDELDAIRRVIPVLALPAFTTRGGAAGVSSLNALDADNLSIETFKRHWHQTLNMITERGLPVDISRIDYRVAKNMLSAGFESQQIAAAMLACSPDLQSRKSNPMKYVTDTVSNAASTHTLICLN